MITIYTNSLESGDWCVIKDEGETVYEGHKPSVREVAEIFGASLVETNDEQIQNLS